MMRPSRAHTHAIARLALAALFLPSLVRADARPRELMDAAALRLALHKLNVVGSALYIAAHPDDENTAFLTYLSRDRLVRTGYLSLTRGDGGQNLLGTETGEALGVIRTQELLAARRVDGAEQWFTRALDFGFSKNPDETFAIWGREQVLADVVWVIRRFRPDIIVTRFPTDGSGGHGHHTASAILAEEAFAAAADPKRFPEQLDRVRPWQAKRILWNVFRSGFTPGDPKQPGVATVDLGSYNPLLGRAYSEIAGESRSMHKSQGFGAPERRGSIVNTFEVHGGAPVTGDLFDGIDLTWARIPGAEAAAAACAEAERRFDPAHPAAILPLLLKAHAAMAALSDDPGTVAKRADLLEVIRSCTGTWIEAVAAAPASSPGGTVKITASILNRSDAPLTLERIEMPQGAHAQAFALRDDGRPDSARRIDVVDRPLANNRAVAGEATVTLPADAAITQPYWLRERSSKGLFQVADTTLLGRPENPPALTVRFIVRAGAEQLAFDAPVVYRWTDPVQGERYRPLEIVPPVTARFDQGVYVFPDRAPRELRVTMRSAAAPVSGTLRLALPAGWSSTPASAPVALAGRESEASVRFMVTPGTGVGASVVTAQVASGGRTWAFRQQRIDYPHLPVETLFPPAEARLVRADLRHEGHEVGYLMGSGDQVPDALRQIGYHVTLLADEDLDGADLARFDAIVVGVRAYNTRPRLRELQPRLLEYARAGGTLVLQYNTADDALDDRLGPYPFKISRDRVTVEEAPIRMLAPASVLLNRPNRIGADDWNGWVQERGLYFPGPWDARYQTVISSNDPGESAKDSSILYAPVGKGAFVYTTLSWFRELPAGVPGAYRLFANLVSAGRTRAR